MGVQVTAQHFTLGSGMLAVCSDVDSEILIMLGFGESIMLLQSIDFGFTDRRNLALVRVKCREAFRSRSLPTNRTECVDQVFRLRLLLGLRPVGVFDAETIRKFLPKLGMIRRASFFIDQVVEQLFPRGLMIAVRMHRR